MSDSVVIELDGRPIVSTFHLPQEIKDCISNPDNYITVDPSRSEFVTLHNPHQQTDFARMSGETHALCVKAGERLKQLLFDREREPLTMKDAIALAADEAGCAREDLCSYLLALGIGSLR